jgi:hypothetical protein
MGVKEKVLGDWVAVHKQLKARAWTSECAIIHTNMNV